MSVSHVSHDEPTRVDVWTVLKELPQRVQALLKRHDASQELGFEELEHELHALFTHAECAATSEALERHDVDLPHVFIDAEKHHRAYRCEKTYLCAVGPVTAMRTLYRARPGERAVAAMERKAGIVEGYWTPHAARQGAMLTAHLVPREAEEVLGVLGNMTPSKSSLDRLPKALSARWEAQRPQFEARVREDTLEVADTACTVAVSLDGVMAPIKTGGGGYRGAARAVPARDGCAHPERARCGDGGACGGAAGGGVGQRRPGTGGRPTWDVSTRPIPCQCGHRCRCSGTSRCPPERRRPGVPDRRPTWDVHPRAVAHGAPCRCAGVDGRTAVRIRRCAGACARSPRNRRPRRSRGARRRPGWALRNRASYRHRGGDRPKAVLRRRHRPRGGRCERRAAERRAPNPQHSAGGAPGARKPRPRVPLPRLHRHPPPPRPSRAALGQRRRDLPRQPHPAVPDPSPAGARGRIRRAAPRRRRVPVHQSARVGHQTTEAAGDLFARHHHHPERIPRACHRLRDRDRALARGAYRLRSCADGDDGVMGFRRHCPPRQDRRPETGIRRR